MDNRMLFQFMMAFLVLLILASFKVESIASKQERKILLDTYKITKGDPQYSEINNFIKKELNLKEEE